MSDNSEIQLISSISVALITGIVSIIVTYIQVSKKDAENSTIALPKGIFLKNRQFPKLWIVIIMVLGGVLGYFGSGYLKYINTNIDETKMVDDFSKKSLYWPTGKVEGNSSVSQSYQINGIYYWEASGFDNIGVTIEPDIPILTNFEYSLDIKQVKGPDDIAYGIFFRSNVSDGWYIFSIRNNGTFNLLFAQPDGYKKIITWTKSSVIGINTNSLKVVATENNLELYVNNSLVGSIIDNSSRFGKIGIYVGLRNGDNVAFEIDNFEIRFVK